MTETWKIVSDTPTILVERDGEERLLITVERISNGAHAEARRAGRLIAAAPRLLIALKCLVEWEGRRTVKGEDALLPPEQQEPEIREAMLAIAEVEKIP